MGILDLVREGEDLVENHNAIAATVATVAMHQKQFRQDGVVGKVEDVAVAALDGKVLSDIFAGKANTLEKGYGIFAVAREAWNNSSGLTSIFTVAGAVFGAVTAIHKFEADAVAKEKKPAESEVQPGAKLSANHESPGFLQSLVQHLTNG